MIKNPFVPGLVCFGNLIVVTMLFVLISKPECIKKANVGSFVFDALNPDDDLQSPKNSLEAMVHPSQIMTDMS